MNEQIYTSPFQGYDAGVQGLAQLGRNAIDRVSELGRGIAERDETIRQLRARAVNAAAAPPAPVVEVTKATCAKVVYAPGPGEEDYFASRSENPRR